MSDERNDLEAEYHLIVPVAEKFCKALAEQCEELIQTNGIPLGVPIEHRVKSWKSISDKIDRKSLQLKNIRDLPDLVGIRLIVLFIRDLEKVRSLLTKTFKVLDREDTQVRLDVSQFGYQSYHYNIRIPDSWLSVPSLAPFKGYSAEIQLRTVAQHIWAAASHVLQYKQEEGIPQPVRRSIHRVSALLETVDLEFEHALEDRDQYRNETTKIEPDTHLNVDLLERILDSFLPIANKSVPEPYAELLEDLTYFGISTIKDLKVLIDSQLPYVLEKEAVAIAEAGKKDSLYHQDSPERKAKGVFFTHAGLIRIAMNEKFRGKWNEYAKEKFSRRAGREVVVVKREKNGAAQQKDPPDKQ